MSDLETLIVTFQTQLSDVMETVLKTAMYEVTRLVEDGFMEEVRRSKQEVELLRTQLQWAERKLCDEEGAKRERRGRCDCGKDDEEVSFDISEERPTEFHYSVMEGCGVKQEDNSMDRSTRSCRQEVTSESTQGADKPTPILSPARKSQAIEEDSVRPTVDVKVEEFDKPSCSVKHQGGWDVSHDGGTGPESHSLNEMTDVQLTQQNSKELLTTVIKQDLQTSAKHSFTEDQEDTTNQYTHMVTEPSQCSPLEVDSKQAVLTLRTTGLPQKHTLATEQDCEPAFTKDSPKRMGHKLVDTVTTGQAGANPQVRDQSSSSGSPTAKLQISNVGDVVIKQEMIVSDGGEEEEEEVVEIEGSGMESSSCSVNKYRVIPEILRQNHISQKPTAQEVIKQHTKVGSSLILQAGVPQLNQPIKKPPHTLTTNTATAHSQVGNLTINRTPSTSRPAPPPPYSVQRAHLSDKQSTTHTRTGVPWVSIKTHHQAANSHHQHSHPGSHPHHQPGPRHLLRCGQCGKGFPHPSNLKAHLQTHTGERPFCCSLCGRSFTKLSNLKAHRRVHTGERPYCCMACGKRFTQKCNLKRHQRIHLDV
ncbi:uncharacterized protein ACJ7VT_018772 [Polymixia lowei]